MKRLLALVLCITALLTGCSSQRTTQDETKLHILATTYPIYLFTKTLTEGVDGVEVTQLIDETVSCLHDYTLTVTDMKTIERADVIVMNGVELELFMKDALARTNAVTIDCSTGIELRASSGHEHHDGADDHHHGHYDPHYWLTEEAALVMLRNILHGLSNLDSTNSELYHKNFNSTLSLFPNDPLDVSELSCPYLITFHDGFHYMAHDLGLTLLKSIEEEEGSTASAAEIKEIVELIKEYKIPAIFTEKNGSQATAKVISRETGVEIVELDMIMSGYGTDITAYFEAMNENYAAIREALK